MGCISSRTRVDELDHVENAGHAVHGFGGFPSSETFLSSNKRGLQRLVAPAVLASVRVFRAVSKRAIDRPDAEEMQLTVTVPPRPWALSRRIKITSNIVIVTMGNGMIMTAKRSYHRGRQLPVGEFDQR